MTMYTQKSHLNAITQPLSMRVSTDRKQISYFLQMQFKSVCEFLS